MKSFLVCLFLFGLAAARPGSSCRSLLLDAGFSENFNETVAHAVHSLTVQGLRMFNPRSVQLEVVS